VILCSHVALNSLSMSCSFTVDILSSLVSSNKGDSLDILVFADLLSGLEASLNNINYTLGKINFLQ
jgi:hypothetical protein